MSSTYTYPGVYIQELPSRSHDYRRSHVDCGVCGLHGARHR